MMDTHAMKEPAQQQAVMKDIMRAASVDDIMEMRKQETRRRVTYGVVGVLCLTAAYLIGWGSTELSASAFSGLLGIAGSIIGFYFGAKDK